MFARTSYFPTLADPYFRLLSPDAHRHFADSGNAGMHYIPGNYRRNPIVMAIFAPGMATQYLTTREPDAGQTEVALAALYSVLTAEGHVISSEGLLQDEAEPDPEEPAVATA